METQLSVLGDGYHSPTNDTQIVLWSHVLQRLLNNELALRRIRLFSACIYLGLMAWHGLPKFYDMFITIRSLTTGIGGHSIFDPVPPPHPLAGVFHYAQLVLCLCSGLICFLSWGQLRKIEGSDDDAAV